MPTIIGKWEIQLRDKGTEKIIAERPNLISAIKGAEEVVKKYFKDSMGLVRLNSRWRHEPATLKQINLLEARKIQVPKGLTKGQASHLIGMLSQ